MLRLLIEKCRDAGADKLLLTCDKKNTASARTIAGNGGILENEVEDAAGTGKSRVIQRYWIKMK